MTMYPFGRGWARATPYVCMAVGMLVFVVFAFGPSLATVVFSFTDISGVPDTSWHFIGLANYQEFFSTLTLPDSLILPALQHTLVFAASVTLIQNALALLVASLLNAHLRGRVFVRALVFLPTVLGVTVIGLTWTLVLNPVGGPAANFLNLFGITTSFFGDYTWAFPLCIAVQIWSALGFSTVIYLAGLQAIPGELREAASIDGANAWQAYRAVVFPLLAPTVTINVLLAIIGSLQTWQIIYILTNGQQNTSVLALQIFQYGFSNGPAGNGSLRQGYAASLAMVQFALVLVVALVFLFYLRRREVQL
ncbi:MAG TPA: sugar ABC transporter permease [Chloroflexota bacterium]|nr:sugar ABC transporter permease [Chloroflexota bacterium]